MYTHFTNLHTHTYTQLAATASTAWDNTVANQQQQDARRLAGNSNVAKNGYSLPFTNKPTPLGYSSAWGTPQRGWQGRYHGPWINHTCCSRHCNTAYVADEDAHTYNVITTQVVAHRQEYLANYMAGYARPHNAAFQQYFGVECACCACTHRTPQCQSWGYRAHTSRVRACWWCS